jgi:hypothetical protein
VSTLMPGRRANSDRLSLLVANSRHDSTQRSQRADLLCVLRELWVEIQNSPPGSLPAFGGAKGDQG